MNPIERQKIINRIWIVIFIAAGFGMLGGIYLIARAFARVILEIK